MELETTIWNLFIGVFGSQALIGIFVLIFLFGLCFLLRLSYDAMIGLSIPILATVFVFIPELRLVFGIIIGILIGIGLLKLISR